MRWHLFVGSALVACGAVLSGCARDRSLVESVEPDLVRGIAEAGPGEPLSRSQKPDSGVRSASLLDTAPERSSEVVMSRPAARVRALVNGEAILDEELKAASYQGLIAAESLPEPERTQRRTEILTQALTQLVEREVVLQDAFGKLKKNPNGAKYLDKLKEAASKEFEKRWVQPIKASFNLKTDEDLKNFLASQKLALEMVKRQWERNFMASEYLRQRVGTYLDRIGNKDVLGYYDAHPEEFQVSDSVVWQDIYIDATRYPSREAALRFAESLAQRARQGEDFAKLAKSFDNGDSSLRNGEGRGRKRGDIDPREAEEPLFKLKDGEVGPIIQMDRGFHIIRLVKREYAGMLPFNEKVQKEIRDKLRGDVAQREIKHLVEDLKSKAVIEYASAAN
jgi:parvulin-like peptidyl-prolyl isomerase